MSRTPLFRSLRRSFRQSFFDQPVTRRELIAGGSSALLISSLPACVRGGENGFEVKSERGDAPVAIIGGGLAGLTAAYTLAKARVKVDVFEASPRLGGRVWTERGFNREGMFVERGGEFIDTSNREIRELAQELGLETQPLYRGEKPPETIFFEGKWRGEGEVLQAFAPLARKIQADTKAFMGKDGFVIPSYKTVNADEVKVFDHMTIEEYLQGCRNEVEPWLLNLIRVAYIGEYGLEADQQSLINLFALIAVGDPARLRIFGESDEAFRIKGGNSGLVEKLEERLAAQGIHPEVKHRLISIAQSSTGFQLVFDHEGKTVEKKYARVILALPLKLLSEVEGIRSLGLSPRKLRCIDEWGFGTNAKIMVGFKDRIWTRPNMKFPASEAGLFTDLPLQACWDTSRGQEGSAGIYTNFLGGKRGATASEAMISEIVRDLEALYPGARAAHDDNKVWQVWTSYPFNKGSYTCPRPGQYTSLMGAAGEAELKGTLLFAGEHCSVLSSGYMNGAVETGLLAARQLLEVRAG